MFFALWLLESLPNEECVRIRLMYSKVKQPEKELCDGIHVNPADLAKRVNYNIQGKHEKYSSN